MTKKQIKKFVEEKLAQASMIDTETGLEAVSNIAEIAAAKGVEWALVGGLAMHVYGSPRLTKDVDIIAAARLDLKTVGSLKQGGERYEIKVGEKKVAVDWIVREDIAKRYFAQALEDAVEIGEGLLILTPEWLLILKYIAGRFKDQEDGVFLLRRKDLLNRKKVKSNVIKVGGEDAWIGFKAGLARWYDIADGKITDGDENESYTPF